MSFMRLIITDKDSMKSVRCLTGFLIQHITQQEDDYADGYESSPPG